MLIHKPVKRLDQEAPDIIDWCNGVIGKLVIGGARLSGQQEQLVRAMEKDDFGIIVKSYRVAGLTTIMMLVCAYKALYCHKTCGKKMLYVSHNKQSANEAMKLYKKILDAANEQVYIEKEDSLVSPMLEVSFLDNKSTLVTKGGDSDFNIFDYSMVMMDNAAWIEGKENHIWEMVDYGRIKGTPVCIGSIPNIHKTEYQERFDKALYAGGLYEPVVLNWYLDPLNNKELELIKEEENCSYKVKWNGNMATLCEYLSSGFKPTSEWRRKYDKLLGRRDAAREIDGIFVDTSRTICNGGIDDDYTGEIKFY